MFKPSWEPQFEFHKGMDHEIQRDEQSRFNVVSIHDFFGKEVLKKILNPKKDDDIQSDDIQSDDDEAKESNATNETNSYRSIGYLASADYICSLTVNEPFELASFPLDVCIYLSISYIEFIL